MSRATDRAPRLVVRIKLRDDNILGPGKADLLEHVDRCGSISAAARELGMSYRQAWMLIDTLNAAFARPVIDTAQGGRAGGGARLTAVGKQILASYRHLQGKAEQSARADLDAIARLMTPTGGRPARPRS